MKKIEPVPFVTRRKLFGVYFLFVAFLTPQIIVLLTSKEVWPFTSAPMFASPTNLLYRFEWLLESPGGTEQELRTQDLYWKELPTMRHFFLHVYGSALNKSPHSEIVKDTPGLFRERLGAYFQSVFNEISLKRPSWIQPGVKLRLSILPVDGKERPLERRTVGFYDPQKQLFTHTWTPGEQGK